MRARLAALGAGGVEARTFHSAALAQLHRYAPGSVGRILPTKALLLRQIANALPPPYKFRPGRRSRHRGRARQGAAGAAGGVPRARSAEHEPPIPANLMYTVYREYERRKAERGEIDFEDVLELAVQLFETDEQARAEVRDAVPRLHGRRVPGREPAPAGAARPVARHARRPLRGRRRLPVDLRLHRSLARVAARASPGASRTRPWSGWRRTTARLPRCWSSRTGSCRGSAARRRCLRATRPDGPEPALRPFASAEAEDRWLAERAPRTRGRRRARWRTRRSCAARTRGWPTSKRCCTRPACPSRARRSSVARRRDACSACSSESGRLASGGGCGSSRSMPAGSKFCRRSSANAS